MKYHISSDGSPKRCTAKNGCPLGADTPHGEFASAKDAQAWTEKALEQIYGVVGAKLVKASNARTDKEVDARVQAEKAAKFKRASALAEFAEQFATLPKVSTVYPQAASIEAAMQAQASEMESRGLLADWYAEKETALNSAVVTLRNLRDDGSLWAAGLKNYNDVLLEHTYAAAESYKRFPPSRRGMKPNGKIVVDQRMIHLDNVNAISHAMNNVSAVSALAKAIDKPISAVEGVLADAQDWFIRNKNSKKTVSDMAKNYKAFGIKGHVTLTDEDYREILAYAARYSNH